jgi:LysM repeat protein
MTKLADVGEPRDRHADLSAAPIRSSIEMCPYLLAASGGWRASSPSREHRCTATAPAARLATDKQRRLCLVAAHETCATYLAALEARRERGIPADGPVQARWAVARTTPVVDVGLGAGAAVAGLIADRRGWQAVPAIALIAALAALGEAGLGRDRPGTAALPSSSAQLTPSATPPATPGPTPTPASTASPSASPTPAPTVTEPPPPSPSPVASARTTYRVKNGDTLYDIARAHGVSVAAIKELNGLTSNIIHVGQVLLIP